jgi:hypothetical protein
MADIKCPMCGKFNPAGSTTCRYCNSRLMPVGSNPAEPTPPARNQDDAPDWLNSLRDDTTSGAAWNEQSPEENPQTNSPSEGDAPDWLTRIRERNQDDAGAGQPTQQGMDNPSQASSEKEELPEWLNQSKPSVNSSSTTALEEWLKKLREDEPAAEEKPAKPIPASLKQSLTKPKAPAAKPDDETSEWLKGLQTWKPSSPLFDNGLSDDQAGQTPANKASSPDQKTPSVQPAAQENIETPDWLKGFSKSEPPAQTSAQPTSEEMADWLSRLPEQQPVSPGDVASMEAHTGVTDWLKHLPSQSSGLPTPETDSDQTAGTPDWLRDLRAQPDLDTPAGLEPAQNAASGQPNQGPAALPAEETSDWFKNTIPIPLGPATPSAALPAEESSDWFKNTSPIQLGPSTPSQTVLPQSDQQIPAVPSDETPDWLKNLASSRAEAPAQPDQDPPALPAEETPDWLKSLAPSQAEATVQPIQDSPVLPADETPDWLKNLTPSRAEAPVQPVQQTPAVPADETSDWLSKFTSNQNESAAPAAPAQEAPAAPAEETPDWLKNLAPIQSQAAAQPDQEIPVAPVEETPDWLKNFASSQTEAAGAAVPVQKASAEPAEETPDWLKNFTSDQSEKPTSGLSVQQAANEHAEEIPDWLKTFSAGQAETDVHEQPIQETLAAAPSEETPDWMKNLTPNQAETAAFSAALPAQDNEVPDWLQNVSAQPAEDSLAHPVKKAGSELPASPTAVPAQPAEQFDAAQVQPAVSDEVPDWLQNLSGRPASAAMTPELTGGESTPDWLQSFGSASSPDSGTTGQPISEPAAAENTSEQEPDWLSNITKVAQPVDQAGTPPPAIPAIETSGAVLGEIPDWLSNIKPQEIPAQEDAGRPAFVLDNNSIELPTSEQSGKNPFAGEGVPDWLSEIPQGADIQSAQPGQADGSAEQLEPAQLPGWLQAMRPLEAVAPSAVQVDDQRVEKSGPLAGLKGILPADDVVTQYRKPPSYSAKLKVTEKQRASANLLEQMLGQESSPQAIPQEHVRIPQRLVRLIIAILLMAVLLFPLLTSGAGLIQPTITPPASVVQFHTALDALPDGGQVLLAVDYDPGFAGEMRFAAAGVLERLIEKNETLVLVSTVPAGPVMAQALISQTLQDRPDLAAKYSVSSSVVNLGYLPGGAASLQEFASAPRQAAQYGFRAGVDSNSPWLQPAVQNIQDVSQFSMVMVLTDSLDSGRAWIEQVQPALKTTPLMMVVSAQTAPLIQPYVASGQVKAMISGLSGGTAYQQYLKSAVNSLADWNAYTYGLLVMVAFILLGIVLQIGTFLFSHRKGGG